MGKFKVFLGYDCVQKNNNNNNNVNNEAQRKKKNESGEYGGGGKKDNNNNNVGNAVVLKIDLHCEGCSSKIVKYIRGFPGVETVKADGGTGKITVTGKVDAVKLREKLEEKMHKKVELLSPAAKKEKGKNDEAADGKGEEKKKDSKENKPTDKNNNNNNKSTNKNQKDFKEPQVTTAVLKVPLHCEGCIQKIHKIVTKTKGFEEIKVDKQKDLVTVKGAMDMKDLVESLKKHLKRDVEIVPPKKDEKKGKGSGGGGEGKAAAAGGGGGGSGGGRGGEGGGEKMEGSKMQQQVPQPPPPFGPFGYGYCPNPSPFVYGGPGPAYFGDPYQVHYQIHAPQLFSDENPNACSIM